MVIYLHNTACYIFKSTQLLYIKKFHSYDDVDLFGIGHIYRDINSLRPSDAYMRRLSNHHCFR